MPRSKKDPVSLLINAVLDMEAGPARQLVKTLQVLVDRRLEPSGNVPPRRPRPAPVAQAAAPQAATPRRRRRTRAEMQAAESGAVLGAPGLPSGEVGG